MSTKSPGPIDYPNRIEDHQTLVKMREMIDGHNSLVATTAAHSKILGEMGSTMEALPQTYQTAQGVVNQIGMYVSTPTFLTGLNSALVKLGFTVPIPPTATGLPGAAPVSATPMTRMAGVRLSGPRLEAPKGLPMTSAGLLYYCTDYAHLCLWDGWAWQISDPGGYLVQSEVQLGVGWQLCDGTATDYLLNDTADLEVAAYTTPRHRFRRSHQYFRR